MAESTEIVTVPVVQVAHDVIGSIAGIAAAEVPGIAGMSGGLVGGLTEMLGKRSLGKGVRVEVRGTVVTLDLFVIVAYGSKIPEVAVRVQDVVKKQVESMTGLTVGTVNIHVQGISFAPPAEDAPSTATPMR